jgi:hypothetical protein
VRECVPTGPPTGKGGVEMRKMIKKLAIAIASLATLVLAGGAHIKF